jgi:hypothetical protein
MVGEAEAQQKFEIHKGLLIHYSGYFRNALKDAWAEGTDKTVKLPGEYQDAFEIFYNWLYTRTMYTPTDKGEIPLGYRSIVESYVFGDAHQIPEFSNAALNTLVQKIDQEALFPVEELEYIYENTLPDSLLRKYLTDDVVACYLFDDFGTTDDFPKDFMRDIILASRKAECAPGLGSSPHDWANKLLDCICDYHDHTDMQG